VLFILMPVIVLCAQIRFVQVTENIGPAIEKSKAWADTAVLAIFPHRIVLQ